MAGVLLQDQSGIKKRDMSQSCNRKSGKIYGDSLKILALWKKKKKMKSKETYSGQLKKVEKYLKGANDNRIMKHEQAVPEHRF